MHQFEYETFSFGRLAYSDILSLYGGRDLPSHRIPYARLDIEYPVITGFLMWGTALLPGIETYFVANALLLAACAVATFAFLVRLAPANRLWQFAAAPMLSSYGTLNWDLLSLLELVAALYCLRRQRFVWAGILLASGTWTKLYPGFALPVIVAYTVRLALTDRVGGRRSCARILLARDSPAARFLAGFVVVTVALNLPLVAINFRGWSYPFAAQASRIVNPDSVWAHVPGITVLAVNLWFPALFAWIVGTVALRTWRGGRWEAGVLVSLLAFLLFTKDYSPQYDIWVLPLLVILGSPVWLWIAFSVVDFVYYAAIFLWLAVQRGGPRIFPLPHPDIDLGIAVWGREVALALLFIWAYQQFAREPREQKRVEAADSHVLQAEAPV